MRLVTAGAPEESPPFGCKFLSLDRKVRCRWFSTATGSIAKGGPDEWMNTQITFRLDGLGAAGAPSLPRYEVSQAAF